MQDKFIIIEKEYVTHRQSLVELKGYIYRLTTETGWGVAGAGAGAGKSFKKVHDELKKNQVLLDRLLYQHCDSIIPTQVDDPQKYKTIRKEWVRVIQRLLGEFDQLEKYIKNIEELLEFVTGQGASGSGVKAQSTL